jgi:hypothetical protein
MALKKFGDFNPEDFKKKETQKEVSIDSERIEDDTMSDDLSGLKDELDKVVKAEDSEFEIVGINDVSLDAPLELENMIEEGATIINADIGNKEVKRGDILYITAMVKKKNVNWNSMAVLKVRIVDIYQGLSILNSLK